MVEVAKKHGVSDAVRSPQASEPKTSYRYTPPLFQLEVIWFSSPTASQSKL